MLQPLRNAFLETPLELAGQGFTENGVPVVLVTTAHTHTFASLTSRPTTIGGYGITDFDALGDARWSAHGHTHAQADISNLTNDLGLKAPLASPTFSGILTAPSLNLTGPHVTLIQGTTNALTTSPTSGKGGTYWYATDVVINGVTGSFNIAAYDYDASAWKAVNILGQTIELTSLGGVITLDGAGVNIGGDFNGGPGTLTINGLTADRFLMTDVNKTLVSKTAAEMRAGILPSQTGNSGKVLQTNGTDVSWQTDSAGIPGGSDTQIQYNNAGVFGGISALTWNGTTLASTAPITGTKLTLATGSIATSQPVLDLSQTWNAAGVTFTGLKLNVTDTASAAASLLMDLQVGGASVFNVSKAGALRVISNSDFGASSGVRINNWVTLSSGGQLNWTSGAVTAAIDLTLARDAANTLALRNSTNAQTFNIYNTYTSGTVYERGFARWSSDVFVLGTEQAGATARATAIQSASTINFRVNNLTASAWLFNTSGHFLANADNTYDIGASGATRPRALYLGTSFNTLNGVFRGSTSGTTTLSAQAIAGSGTVTLPLTGTLATLDGTETLTNKSINATQLTGTIASARLPAALSARAYNNANISIPNATITALTFNSERWDTNAIHDNSTNPERLTCKTAGVYTINAQVLWDANVTGYREITIRLNGTTVIGGQNSTANSLGYMYQSVSTIYALAVNDYVEIMAAQDSGGALNVLSSGNSSPEFSMVWMGP